MAEETKTRITSDLDLTLEEPEPYQPLDLGSSESLERTDEKIDEADQMLDSLRSINKDRLEGRVPGDVAKQLRDNTAAGVLSGGMGVDSPAARGLQARDLGLTSLQIQDAGMQVEQALATTKGELAKLEANQYQFKVKQEEQSRQFGESLALEDKKVQILYNDLLLKQDTFNKSQNLKMMSLIADIVDNQLNLQLDAAEAEIDDGFTAGYDRLINLYGSSLRESN